MKNFKNRAIALILSLAMCLSTSSAIFADEELNAATMAPAEEIVKEAEAEKIKEIKEEAAEKAEEEKAAEAAPEMAEEKKAAEEMQAVEFDKAIENVEKAEKAETVSLEKLADGNMKEADEEKTEKNEKTENTENVEESLLVKAADEQVKEAVKEDSAEIAVEKIADKLPEAAAAPVLSGTVIENVEKIEDVEKVEEVEEVEEEPFVSDAVSVNVTGTFTWYLENPERTIKLTGTNYNSATKTAANKADDQEIIWSSGNEELATVDENGLVTILATEIPSGKGTDKITITATAKNNPDAKVTKTITVKHIAKSNVTMSVTGATSATIGTDLQLGVKFSPGYAIEALGLEDAEITWTLENGTEKATINENGLLTPLEAGSVKVIVTNDFNTVKITKTITIKAPVLVSRLSMSPSSAKLTIKGEDYPTKQLKATAAPSTASDKSVTWSSDNEDVAVVDENGLVTAVGEGSANITAVSVSNPEAVAVSRITVDRYVPVESLSISDWMTRRESKEMTVITGGYADLLAQINPGNASNKKLIWSCSDESVLEMTPQGTYNAAEALKPGTAVITVTSADDPEISAQITINVIDPKELTYDIHVTHYFTKVWAGEYVMNGVPSSYEFKIDGGTKTEKAGTLVHADDYIFQPPLVYPYTFTYEGETYTLNGSAVMALGNNLMEEFELTSDVEIIYIYSAVAPYSLTVNFIDADTDEVIKDAYVYNYNCMGGYIEMPYDLSKFVEKQKNFATYDFVRTEGDVLGSWDEDHMDKVVNLYYTLKEHTVTYEYTGEVPEGAPALPAEASYKVGAKVEAAAVPALTGYEFSGWVGEVDTMPNEAVKVTGSWTPVSGLYYTVNYLEEDTDKVLAEKKVVNDLTFGEEVTEDAIDIDGYNKGDVTTATITISADSADNEINFYYTAVASSTSKKDKDVAQTAEEEEIEENEEIEDDDTPLAPIVEEAPAEEEEEEIAGEEVPLAGYEAEEEILVADNELPKTPLTGDDRNTAAWLALSLLSLAGIAVLGKRKEEEL